MKYLITLSLAALTLYVFVKQSYKRATMQDEVDIPVDYELDRDIDRDAIDATLYAYIGMGRV